MLSYLFSILVVILTYQSLMEIVQAFAGITFIENLFSFGELQRHKNTFEDIKFLVSHRTIPASQLASNVTDRNVKVFHIDFSLFSTV